MRWVYDFSEGSRDMRELLGGKGANVAEMTRVLGAERVPAGFTITTEACVAYMRDGRAPDGMDEQVRKALHRLQEHAGRTLGDPSDPLLVSVRSGARESMPGMLDTVLNLGLNDRSVEGLADRTGNERFAWDSYRRFVQMFGNVVRDVEGERFEDEIKRVKRERGVQLDTDLDVDALRELTRSFQGFYDFPQDPAAQLEQAIRAVFDSWTGDRAVTYRRINRIPDDWGTAVNVQQMVFGNKGDTSGSGVAFSRDEVTGAPEPSGDFLANAQGEDVVSGVRNTRDIAELRDWQPEIHEQLTGILRTLEAHYKDMQDCEFTVEEGRLYMLQTRSAKRPAQAAVRFAVDAVGEGLLAREEAIATIDAEKLDALLHPTFDPDAAYTILAQGVAASPGAAKGAVVFTASEAVEAGERGEGVILVRPFTEADDVAGFHAAKGILTSEGGKASHAALVARGMGVPAVTGASDVEIDLATGEARVGDTVLHAGDLIAIDGTTGTLTVDDVPLVEPEVSEHFETVLAWCDELRRLGVRANADTPDDALRAREFGAEGIGLCRTEHMFLGERQQLMADVILADDEEGRRAALAKLRPLQQEDFAGLFEAMEGLPVTIRLLDPPLHEFLPHRSDVERAVERARVECSEDLVTLEHTLERVRALEEVNPMLGMRGVRLGIVYPEIYEMQVIAIARAAKAVSPAPHLEIMIPLVGYERELELMRGLVERVAHDEGLERGRDYSVGTMIELPRACFIADHIATQADFFSFGTNDLTQTALGFSRDDIEGKILSRYIDTHILDRSPFETIDTPGVGQMLRMGAWLGRQGRADLKLGICGEHGGDPDSIDFFHHSGLDYVSCSPFRVPIARVAAAQAAIADGPAI
ncbi:pyruvate, phosphate dikinase [Capillimicrobium parvum]|uniref:Pyruvate, phosphate dikinase n=1 Tax=Capillimicrobium parvum TaxID=2884022 RepID=A0A9E6XZ69_9ACTN|nr:pyruvate, phosphate dikinase [Capillimicrobium parvum]UGS37084.1 Pyruvate, phosphate dikinase [Capillimicrobium parvum]